MKYKIKDLFNVLTGIRITEKDVYNHKGLIPCVTSQTKNNGIAWYADEKWLNQFKKSNKLVLLEVPCITWAKDGDAGKLFYRDYKFYPNDHCGVLIPKNTNTVNLKWFLYTQEEHIKNHVINKEGQGMLYNEQMEEILIELPSIEQQKQIVNQYFTITSIREKIKEIENRLDKLLKCSIFLNFPKISIKEICYVERGDVISDSEIYYNKGSIPVYSSKTQNDGILGYVNDSFYKNHKKGNSNTLTWNTDGKAGTIFKRNRNYLFTNVCGQLKIKNLNQINLDYLHLILKQETYKHVTSMANNGKLMKEQMENIYIPLPPMEIQLKIVKEISALIDIKNSLINISLE